jgi:lysophospholipase L1-like esterase
MDSYTVNSDPADLQNLLRQQFGSMVEVSNQGVSGTQALQLLNGTDQNHAPWAAQMAASKAAIVTINFARNDALYNSVPTPGMTPVPPEQYGQIMTQLVRIAKAAGKQVVLYEPDPTAFSDANIALEKYVAQLKAVATAEQVPIVFQWEYAQGLPNYGSLLTDGVHPTDALYAFNAQWESQVIAPMVQSLLR